MRRASLSNHRPASDDACRSGHYHQGKNGMPARPMFLQLARVAVACAGTALAVVSASDDSLRATGAGSSIRFRPLDTIVRIDSGLVEGAVALGRPDILVYKGFPYAAPPVGHLRWKPPVPAVPWTGTRAATAFGPACAQPSGRPGLTTQPSVTEDCLYLNVWAPRSPTASLPVMVWIHGGGFERGSGSTPVFDGTHLASRGVVVVTINYRLGVFGFFAHPALSAESNHGASGNYGLMDMVAALRWVRRNIAAFGAHVRHLYRAQADQVLALYPASNDNAVRSALDGLIHDMYFAGPARALLASLSQHASPAWLYHFTRVPPTDRGRRFGAHHGAELPYVFGNLIGQADYSDVDRRVSDNMVEYWVQFAKAGDPNWTGIPAWPAHTVASDEHLNIGDEIARGRALHREGGALFNAVRSARLDGKGGWFPEPAPVRTESGLVAGSHGSSPDVQVYRGIPYAAPPVGSLRWKEPQPPASWNGARPAKLFGPACVQQPYPETSVYRYDLPPLSEDCLTLNVWAPASSRQPRPVMVYIHGGGLTRGWGGIQHYEGESLVIQGVVVVTINYRLGIFGLLAHPALTAESAHHASGNYAILDQIAALKWVRTNIAAFGGDPSRLTVFGESAGSRSVALLVATPLARWLFHRAIGQSGGAFAPNVTLA